MILNAFNRYQIGSQDSDVSRENTLVESVTDTGSSWTTTDYGSKDEKDGTPSSRSVVMDNHGYVPIKKLNNNNNNNNTNASTFTYIKNDTAVPTTTTLPHVGDALRFLFPTRKITLITMK